MRYIERQDRRREEASGLVVVVVRFLQEEESRLTGAGLGLTVLKRIDRHLITSWLASRRGGRRHAGQHRSPVYIHLNICIHVSGYVSSVSRHEGYEEERNRRYNDICVCSCWICCLQPFLPRVYSSYELMEVVV